MTSNSLSRRAFLAMAGSAAAAHVTTACATQGKKAAKKPNIIVILADDAGYADFGFTGSDMIPTPNIDRLAERGVVCSQGYVTASTCAPSRMGLMTGRYQQRFGAECNVPTIPTPGFTKEDLGMDMAERTLGDAMRAQGYRTMAIGKWHLGELPQYHPNRRGFDEFYGFLGGSRTYWPLKKHHHGHAMRRNGGTIDEAAEIGYLTTDLTDAALEYVNRDTNQPFFMYLSYNAVHGPYEAEQQDLDQFTHVDNRKRRMLAAMTRSMDTNIGRILDLIDDNTLVIFLNDNGGPANGFHSNAPLRGHKGSYWEGGVRTPFVVSWPARLPQGSTLDWPVSALDILPTCVAAAGGRLDAAWRADGVNLLPGLEGQRAAEPERTLFWRFWRVAAVRRGKWKLIRVAENPLQAERELMLPLMLFNLEEDSQETTNLAGKHPDRTAELTKALDAWEAELAQPRWYDGSDWQHWQAEQLKNHRMQ